MKDHVLLKLFSQSIDHCAGQKQMYGNRIKLCYKIISQSISKKKAKRKAEMSKNNETKKMKMDNI